MSKKTVSIEEMSKDQLRAACKAAGVTGYGKMSNLQMRDALKAAQPAESQEPVSAPERVVTTPPTEEPVAPAAAPAEKPKTEKPAPVTKDQRNGITRPKADSLCAQVWDACDALQADGKETGFEALKEKLPKHADATIRTQRQRWKTYHA